jgi:tetratricopeptide (TPR) repeat protein
MPARIQLLLRFPVIFSLTFLLACGALPGSLRGSSGHWQHLQTEHFDLLTDLGEGDAQKSAQALEQNRDALLTTAWSKAAGSRRTARAAVVVFGDGLEFERYAGRGYSGIFTRYGRPTLFLWGTPDRWEQRWLLDEATTSVLRHEMAHRLAAAIYGRQPRWFSEGLAEFLEAVVIADDGASATLGRPNMSALRKYKAFRSVSVRDALAWNDDEDKDERTIAGLYGVSWMMVHWLYNTHFEAFATYQERLGKGASPGEAWSSTFGDLDLDDMDKKLFEYSRFGEFKELTVKLDPVEAHTSAMSVTAADVHAIHAQFGLATAGLHGKESVRNEARADIERALALEPANVLALRLRQAQDDALPAAEVLRRLHDQVQLRPDDGDAWLLLGELLRGDDTAAEREAALRRAVALLPADASANNELAWVLAKSGRGEAALPLAMKAAMLAPWDAAVIDTYAAALFAVGRCADAVKAQTRAIDLIPEQLRGTKGVRSYGEALRRYRSACGP